jgi:hypothetical protein
MAVGAPAEHDVVTIPIGHIQIEGNLHLPREAAGIVLFAHGSGSSRHSPRNRFVAAQLNEAGLATLLLDLLTPEEEHEDRVPLVRGARRARGGRAARRPVVSLLLASERAREADNLGGSKCQR